MKRILILSSRMLCAYIILSFLPVSAGLQAQELQPVILKEYTRSPVTLGRTYNNYKGSRVLASKKKTYPFLDQMEELLYPGKSFDSQNPGKRLERLEIAVIGAKQKGSIPSRVSGLQLEIESWQIANAQALSIINSKTKPNTKEHAFYVPESKKEKRPTQGPAARSVQQARPYPNYPPPQYAAYSKSVQASPRRKVVDYDYQNYRVATPLLQTIGRKTIDAFFGR